MQHWAVPELVRSDPAPQLDLPLIEQATQALHSATCSALAKRPCWLSSQSISAWVIAPELFLEGPSSGAIGSCTELENLREVVQTLLNARRLQAMFSEIDGAQALGVKRP